VCNILSEVQNRSIELKLRIRSCPDTELCILQMNYSKHQIALVLPAHAKRKTKSKKERHVKQHFSKCELDVI
jgi:hypothetical protein